MGGAGFIYPAKSRASRGYSEGDTVRTQIDFENDLIRCVSCLGARYMYPTTGRCKQST